MLVGASATATFCSGRLFAAAARQKLGLVIYCCSRRRRWLQKEDKAQNLFAPLSFLQHCRSLGAGGCQINLGVVTQAESKDIRDYAETHNLFIEAIIRAPKSTSDTERFEAEVRSAVHCGATVARTTIIPGRRYEQFRRLEDFQRAAVNGEQMLQRAAPIVEKHRLALAVENHKDQRLAERVALFRRIGSEYVGACLDTGNSIALLDDPYDTVDALAPFAHSVHLKDQALAPYGDGFLLADVPLGQGSLDLPKIVKRIRAHKPQIRFSLELITRDPLKVPCLTDRYYATMPEIPASALSRTLQLVRNNTKPGQVVDALPLEKQVKLEDGNVTQSLDYATRELQL